MNYSGTSGWTCNISTDLEQGTISNFVEKEGKYFNYIKGVSGSVDPSSFTFQGIGKCTSVDLV